MGVFVLLRNCIIYATTDDEKKLWTMLCCYYGALETDEKGVLNAICLPLLLSLCLPRNSVATLLHLELW